MNDLAAQAKKVGINISLTTHPFSTVVGHGGAVHAEPAATCKWTAENWGAGWIYGPDYLPTGRAAVQPRRGSERRKLQSTRQMTPLIRPDDHRPARQRERGAGRVREVRLAAGSGDLRTDLGRYLRRLRGDPDRQEAWPGTRPTPWDSCSRSTGTSPSNESQLDPRWDDGAGSMTGFIIRRLGQAIVVVLGVTLITFILLHLLPGSLARDILGNRATPQAIEQFNQQNHLDQSFFVQYWYFLDQLAPRQPRLLLPVQPLGRLPAGDRPAPRSGARGAVADLLAGDRDSDRDRPGREAQLGGRLRRHRDQLPAVLDAAVRDRAAADPVPLDQLPRLSRPRHRSRPPRSECSSIRPGSSSRCCRSRW